MFIKTLKQSRYERIKNNYFNFMICYFYGPLSGEGKHEQKIICQHETKRLLASPILSVLRLLNQLSVIRFLSVLLYNYENMFEDKLQYFELTFMFVFAHEQCDWRLDD